MLGNIIWLLFGGFVMFIEYLVASFIIMATIVGIPFGLQTIKLAIIALWPFGKEVRPKKTKQFGCITTLLNILWLLFGGIWIALSHLLIGIVFIITIVGIPFGKQHLKLARVGLTPFNFEF